MARAAEDLTGDADLLASRGAFGPSPEVWTCPLAAGDPRLCVAMLVRGVGDAAVLLTGHYDTVTADEYGDLAPLATRPGPLAAAPGQSSRGTEGWRG